MLVSSANSTNSIVFEGTFGAALFIGSKKKTVAGNEFTLIMVLEMLERGIGG